MVGRAPHCVLRPTDARVSGEHASLAWSGTTWVVRDLGSRNGTFVDGERLAPGTPRDLVAGAVLGFGTSEGGWRLGDASPPVATAQAGADGVVRHAEDGMLALPGPDAPQVTIFEDLHGGWVAEVDDEVRRVSDGDVLSVGSTAWRLSLPTPLDPTVDVEADGIALERVQLRFAVSRDEEHVELSLSTRGQWEALGARTHHHLLLALARARLEDAAQPELPPGEHGWRYADDVCRMLAIEELRLNTEIYRARKELHAAGVQGAAGLVERRRGTKSLRLGTAQVEVGPPR